jgi:hypothetical protein
MLRQRTGAARFAPAPVAIIAALVACAPASAATPLRLVNRARPAAATTASRPLTTYGGSTSQDAPFALIVSKDHRRLARLLLHADAPCSDGSHATESGPASIAAAGAARSSGRNQFVGDRLPRSGSFRVKGSALEGYGGTLYGKLSETLAGKVKGNRAKGTFRMIIQVVDMNTGAVQATCDTGALTWRSAAVPGKVYAGLTGGGRPVVVALTPDRSMVSDLRIGWDATCQPEGGFLVADHLGNFPVDTSGTFGHPFEAGPFAGAEGSSIALHYMLAGRLTATRATGTFAVRLTQTAADGTTQATCDRPLQHWSATS